MDYEAQVFGFEFSKKEVNRAIRFKEQYPSQVAYLSSDREKAN